MNLKDAVKDRESSLTAAEEGEGRFTDAESGCRRDADNLRMSQDASARADGKQEAKETCPKHALPGMPQRSPTSSNAAEIFAFRESEVVESVATNEVRQSSAGGISDATGQDLAGELLQKLTMETSQRRSARRALSKKARLSRLLSIYTVDDTGFNRSDVTSMQYGRHRLIWFVWCGDGAPGNHCGCHYNALILCQHPVCNGWIRT